MQIQIYRFNELDPTRVLFSLTQFPAMIQPTYHMAFGPTKPVIFSIARLSVQKGHLFPFSSVELMPAPILLVPFAREKQHCNGESPLETGGRRQLK